MSKHQGNHRLLTRSEGNQTQLLPPGATAGATAGATQLQLPTQVINRQTR